MVVAAIVVVLYFLPYLDSLGPISKSLIIPDWGAILAAVTFSFGFLSYLFAPRKYIFPTALSVYLLLGATTAELIFATGGTHSSFVGLWLAVAVFASVFGWWGVAPLALITLGYDAYLFIEKHPSLVSLLLALIIGLAPLVVSYIIFHIKAKGPNEDKAFNDLASELSQVSNKSDVVINAIGDGVIALNSKGVIELINPAAQHIIGWGTSDAVGLDYKSVLKLSDKEDKPLTTANDPIEHVLGVNSEIHTKEFFVTTGGGKRLLLSLVVSPIGQPGEGVIVVFQDITRESAEEREQAEFISTASHEMRTPVASIEGYLGLALNPNTAQIDEKARDFIEKAHASAQHLGRLFQDLLDVSKAEDGRLSNHPGVVDVVDYIGDIAEGLRPKAQEKGLTLLYKPAPDGNDKGDSRIISPVYYANVDNDHLREVVANLVENAIKYTLKGDVVVDVTGDEEHVTISIKDSGIGIAPEDMPHLFQKFYRVDNSATREIGGTGLGLYLCRRLAEVMGGRIWLDSEFGKGSTFYLELPRLAQEEAMHMIDAQGDISPESMITNEHGTILADPTQGITDTADSVTEDISSMPPVQVAQAAPAQAPPVQIPISVPEITIPTPVAPQPPMAAPVVQQPAPAPVAPPTLAAIEQNPASYLPPTPAARSASIQIPTRQNPQNQDQPKI